MENIEFIYRNEHPQHEGLVDIEVDGKILVAYNSNTFYAYVTNKGITLIEHINEASK